MCELYRILEEGGEDTVLAITETQKKYENLCISESYKYLMGMRVMQDKKP